MLTVLFVVISVRGRELDCWLDIGMGKRCIESLQRELDKTCLSELEGSGAKRAALIDVEEIDRRWGFV